MKDLEVIFSGEFDYCCRRSHDYAKRGYVVVDQKKWTDGKWTFKMKLMDR